MRPQHKFFGAGTFQAPFVKKAFPKTAKKLSPWEHRVDPGLLTKRFLTPRNFPLLCGPLAVGRFLKNCKSPKEFKVPPCKIPEAPVIFPCKKVVCVKPPNVQRTAPEKVGSKEKGSGPKIGEYRGQHIPGKSFPQNLFWGPCVSKIGAFPF